MDQFAVEHGDEAPGGLDENGVARAHHGGDAFLKKLGGDGGRGVLFGLGRLAGVQKEQRDTVVADHLGDSFRVDGLGSPLLKLVEVRRVLETQGPQAVLGVVDSVPVEMHNVIGLTRVVGALQLLLQSPEGGGRQKRQLGELAQLGESLDHGLGTDPVVDVSDAIILRARADEQDADRSLHCGNRLGIAVGQPSADPDAVGTMEEVAAIIAE